MDTGSVIKSLAESLGEDYVGIADLTGPGTLFSARVGQRSQRTRPV